MMLSTRLWRVTLCVFFLVSPTRGRAQNNGNGGIISCRPHCSTFHLDRLLAVGNKQEDKSNLIVVDSAPARPPTSMPTISPKRMEILFLELRFAHVHKLLLNSTSNSGTATVQRGQIAVFEMLSLDFLYSQGIAVENFTVSEQSIQNKPEYPRVRRLVTEESSWPETNATAVQPLSTPTVSSISENDSLPGILILQVHIIAADNHGIVETTLRNQWSVYAVSFVSIMLFDDVIAAEGKSRDDTAWLLVSAMVSSLVALAAVVLVRRRLRQTLRRRNFPTSACTATTKKKETQLGSSEHNPCGGSSVDEEPRSDRGNSSGCSQHDIGNNFELEFADMDGILSQIASEQRRVEGTLVSV
jgi:hypothetical protein